MLKKIGALGLFGVSIANSSCANILLDHAISKDRYLVGNIGNTFYAINLNKGRIIEIDIGFVGHSFLQNPVNPFEILIPEKTSNSWCTVNISEGVLVNRVYKSNYTFYGHFAFSTDQKSLFIPKFDRGLGLMQFDILDPRSYKVLESLPVPDVTGFHDLHFNSSTQEIIISAVGFLDTKNEKTNGILVFDPTKNLVKNKIPTYTRSSYPTHLLQLSPYQYFVSMEVPEGHEGRLGAIKDSEGKYIIKPQIREFDIRENQEAIPLNIDLKFDSRLNGNIPYLCKNESKGHIYLGNPHTATIFIINMKNHSDVRTLDIKSKGLAMLNDSLYVCSDKTLQSNEVTNAHDPSDPLLTSIHFNVIEA